MNALLKMNALLRFKDRAGSLRAGSLRAGSLRAVLLLGCCAALLTGCAAADKTATTQAKQKGGGSAMVGMNMGSSTTLGKTVAPSIKGIKPVPTQVLATTNWQGMTISAEAMTAVPFLIFNGTHEREVKPGPKTTFHLMVMLSDAQTHVAIPYASVWATIKKGSKLVYDERLWPMISRYMGPHYGNNVSLPGAGEYKLSLLVAPPVSARHVEYQHVWLKPHRANFTFHWSTAT
jgi:Fe2+ transport protein